MIQGVFRTIRVENGIPLYLEFHLDRLKKECLQVGLKIVLPPLSDCLSQAKIGIWRLRIAVEASNTTLSIQPYEPINAPIRLCIYPEPLANLKVKSLSFLNRSKLLEYAKSNGCDDVLTIDTEGYVLEGAFSNVFWKDARGTGFVDPSLPYYEGLMQELVIKKNPRSYFAKIRPEELVENQIFLCNSLKGVMLAILL